MQILRLSTSIPANKYSTEDLTEIFPCQIPADVKQNILNLGVSKRHLITHANSPTKSETVMSESAVVDLCSEACEDAVDNAGLSVRDIGCFIASYDVNPFLCPGLSQLLTGKLGFDPYIKCTNVQGMACTAFTKALELAENHLAAHPEDSVLLCISGVNSYWFHNQVKGIENVTGIKQINKIEDKTRRRMELRKWVATMEFFLFGDGAAAAIVANRGEGLAVRKIVEVTNLGKKDYLAGYARLSALNEPFKFGFHSHLDRKIPELGVKYTDAALKRLLGKDFAEITKVAKWAVHTGSEKMLKALAEHNQIRREKITESLAILREYGNLAGASLPFILKRIISEKKNSEDSAILMLGYGWGFAASAAMLEHKKQPDGIGSHPEYSTHDEAGWT
jgi:predicted naringenin-chalcone synthase